MDASTKAMSNQNDRIQEVGVHRYHAAEGWSSQPDCLAVEEPMEIRLGFGPSKERQHQNISVTMRTPGDDFDLAAGFLLTEGLIQEPKDIADIQFCGPPAPHRATSNIVRIELPDGAEPELGSLQRHFFMSSSCGLCGKASLDALTVQGLKAPPAKSPIVRMSLLMDLPERLRAAQQIFDRTGGLHAAGLFNPQGDLKYLREDVGRHNAVDKLAGAFLRDGIAAPLIDTILVLSGRISFELLQKALVMGCSIIVAVGAPSSLAVQMAERFGLTLVGFVRDGRCNVYAGAHRILDEAKPAASTS